jgi:hypothetical protein
MLDPKSVIYCYNLDVDRARFFKYYRLLFGLLGFSALVTEIATLIERGYFIPANFFSYFTIESNILAVLTLILYGSTTKLSTKTNLYVQLIRGGVVLYMLMTGVIFAILLAGIEGATLTAVPWDNIVLHYIMPIIILVDWLMDMPKITIKPQQVGIWLIFPIGYIVYTLIRGAVTGWYPYPFLDPQMQGYLPVTVTLLLLAAGVSIACWILYLMVRNKQ